MNSGWVHFHYTYNLAEDVRRDQAQIDNIKSSINSTSQRSKLPIEDAVVVLPKRLNLNPREFLLAWNRIDGPIYALRDP